MLAGGKGGYGICFSCLVSDLLARGSPILTTKGKKEKVSGGSEMMIGWIDYVNEKGD